MKTSEKLVNHLRAGFSCFWLITNEPDRVKKTIYQALQNPESCLPYSVMDWSCITDPKPTAPLETLYGAEERTVSFLYNYHWYISQPQIIQIIQESIPIWANQQKAIIVVSPVNKIPMELEKDFTIIELDLPMVDEIRSAISAVIPDDSYLPENLDEVYNASKGLTRRELENVFSLSLVEHKKFDIATINSYRAQSIKKSGLATVLEPDIKPEDVIGYDIARDQVMSTINNPDSKGVLFIGPPGCGKTTLIKSFASASGKLTIMVNTGALFSKYQGETDKNVRALIELIKALGDCYLVFDEIEKQFSGVGGSGDLDSGVTTRAISQFLEFFQNRPKGCYIGATCNSVKGLPPEYLRAGRWDTAPIYIGLPSQCVRDKIMTHYIKKFNLKSSQTKKIPSTENWSGAEIEALCHNAAMRNISLTESNEFILPLYITMKEEIMALESWAKGRTISAEKIPVVKQIKKRKVEL